MSDNLTVERPECEQLPLVDRLRAVEGDGVTRYYRNPDGPEAADRIEALEAEVERLVEQHSVLDGVINDYIDKLKAERAEVARLQARERELKSVADGAYAERNQVVAAMAKMGLTLGWSVGTARTAIEGWGPEWQGCVYVDLPTGQASWHYHDREAHFFADLPPYPYDWDGHTTRMKYDRLAAVSAETEDDDGK